MSGFPYKPIRNGSVIVYNPTNFLSTNLITLDQLLTKCYTKSQCDSRYISATGDPALFFLDLYNSATVSNVIDWNKPLRVNNFVFPSSGKGLEMAFNASLNTGLIISYDRSTSQYYDLKFNDRLTIKSNGSFRFGTGDSNSPARLSIGNVSDNAISMHWDSSGNSYSMLGVDNLGSLHIAVFENLSSRVAQFVMNSRGYLRLNHNTTSYSTLISNVRAPLDFGSVANRCMINLNKQFVDSAPFFGFGASDNSLQYHSADVNGHQWYYNSSHTESTLTTTLGTNLMSLKSNGNLITSLNVSATAGVHAYGFNTTDIVGPGAHMHYGAGAASYFGYNYSSNTYLATQVGPSVWIHPQSTLGPNNVACGMNINTATSGNIGYVAPLAVYGTQAFTKTGAFGYLNSGGASNASNFTNRNFTIYSDGGILINSGEVDCFSDRRMKRNIQSIDEETAKRFLTLDPVKFQYNVQDESDPKYYYSYIAQDVVAKNIPHIVGYTSLNGETVLEPETIECEDGSVATIDGETKFTLNLLACVPYLHKIIQMQDARIAANEATISELKARLGM